MKIRVVEVHTPGWVPERTYKLEKRVFGFFWVPLTFKSGIHIVQYNGRTPEEALELFRLRTEKHLTVVKEIDYETRS
ncbi:hypothetical protein [Enterobacter phage PF-CE2]|uniref:Uncharacterized protein n=1 Tax=Enterobacter phage PF-CE2 TaxID=2810367 RepID=A0A8A6NI11_9CAUD|nr:hypothetical protein [Enterobacter phage PF-CE2]